MHQVMSSLQQFRCEICGEVTSSPSHWFVIQCSDTELTVLKWNTTAARRTGNSPLLWGSPRRGLYQPML